MVLSRLRLFRKSLSVHPSCSSTKIEIVQHNLCLQCYVVRQQSATWSVTQRLSLWLCFRMLAAFTIHRYIVVGPLGFSLLWTWSVIETNSSTDVDAAWQQTYANLFVAAPDWYTASILPKPTGCWVASTNFSDTRFQLVTVPATFHQARTGSVAIHPRVRRNANYLVSVQLLATVPVPLRTIRYGMPFRPISSGSPRPVTQPQCCSPECVLCLGSCVWDWGFLK